MRRAWMVMATLALALVVALGPMEAAAACLRYGAPVQITGSLNRKPLPGADKLATYWFLRLERPACIDGRPGDGIDAAYDTIREIQLVLTGEMHRRYESLIGTRVTGTGTLAGAHTAHHTSPILLTVRELRRADAR